MGGLPLPQLVIFFPPYFPSQEGLFYPLPIIYSAKTVVTGAITHKGAQLSNLGIQSWGSGDVSLASRPGTLFAPLQRVSMRDECGGAGFVQ